MLTTKLVEKGFRGDDESGMKKMMKSELIRRRKEVKKK
jgi:hypothetical protein